jgi:hypothetical protein
MEMGGGVITTGRGVTTSKVKHVPVSYANIRADMWENPMLYKQLCDKYRCTVCLELYPTVYVTVPCQHLVCLDCALKLPGGTNALCPPCQGKLDSSRVSDCKSVTREVSFDLKLQCIYAAPLRRDHVSINNIPTSSSSSSSDAKNDGGCGGGGESNTPKPNVQKIVNEKKEGAAASTSEAVLRTSEISQTRDVCTAGPIAYGRWLEHCENECLVRDYTCPKCSIVLYFHRYAAHAANDCPNRLVSCVHCTTVAPMSLGALEIHKNVCDGERIPCPNGCRIDEPLASSRDTRGDRKMQGWGDAKEENDVGNTDTEKSGLQTRGEARAYMCADCGKPKYKEITIRHTCVPEDVTHYRTSVIRVPPQLPLSSLALLSSSPPSKSSSSSLHLTSPAPDKQRMRDYSGRGYICAHCQRKRDNVIFR